MREHTVCCVRSIYWALGVCVCGGGGGGVRALLDFRQIAGTSAGSISMCSLLQSSTWHTITQVTSAWGDLEISLKGNCAPKFVSEIGTVSWRACRGRTNGED